MASDHDLSHLATVSVELEVLCNRINSGQAGDPSAIHTQKMGVPGSCLFTLCNKFESPDMIPQLGATEDPCVFEVI